MILIVLLSITQQGFAFTWQDLWWRKDQQGMQLLAEGKASQAARVFESSDWQAVANYRAQNYTQVERLLKGQKDAVSRYNLGNSLALQGKYEEAIVAYENAIKQKPNFADAIYNRDLIKKLLEQKKSQDKQEKNKDKEQNTKQDKQQDQPQDNKQNQQQNDKQEQDQKDPDKQDQQKQSADQNDQDQHKQDQKKQQDGQQPDQQQKNKNDKEEQQGKSKTDSTSKLNQEKGNRNNSDSPGENQGKNQPQKNKQSSEKQERKQPGKSGDETGNEQKQPARQDTQGNNELPQQNQVGNEPQSTAPGDSQNLNPGQEMGQKMTPKMMNQGKGPGVSLKQQKLDEETNGWLQQIPDDPGGLLRRKIMRDHIRKMNEQDD